MIKLLNSNFYRLKKNMCFWILLIIMAYLGVFLYDNYNPIDCSNCDYNRLGSVFFAFTAFINFFIPIFTSSFIGTEYSDGGIKNKIIKGHTRTNIYLSNLLTTIIVSFIYTITFIISINIMGLIWGNHIAYSLDAFLLLLLDSLILNISVSSLFTFITMSISSKTSSSITSFVVVIWSAMIIFFPLQQINHVTGIIKSIYQFILNIIPYGQSWKIMDIYFLDERIIKMIDLTTDQKTLWIYSLFLIIIINTLGIFIINKKELN